MPLWTHRVALSAVLLGAAIGRAVPLLAPNGAQASATFDEGVYMAASGLLSEGAVPYRDFVFVHPPGILLLTWPLSILAPDVLSWAQVLVAVRWLGIGIGVANVTLITYLVSRWQGRWAGLVAGALYAAYDPAVSVERHLLLEPYLVLLMLLAAVLWLEDDPHRLALRPSAAGVLIALAGLVKLTGGPLGLALLVSRRRDRRGRDVTWVCLTAVVTAALILLPFGLVAGWSRLWGQAVGAQLHRPGGDVDGGSVTEVSARLAEVGALGLAARGPFATALAYLVLALILIAAVWAWRGGDRTGRFLSAALVLLLLPPLLAPDWYEQYPVPAAAVSAALLGAAAGHVVRWLRARGPWPAVLDALAKGLLLVLVLGLAAEVAADVWRSRSAKPADFAARINAQLADDDCLVSEPPDLGLAAGRLPVRDRSGSYLVDPFGTLLVISLESERDGSTAALLHHHVAQERLRAAFSRCTYVALRVEPSKQGRLSAETARWFESRFEPVQDATTAEAMLWRRKAPQ